eukprot:7817570-Pyramimonas_sp.AAC.1
MPVTKTPGSSTSGQPAHASLGNCQSTDSCSGAFGVSVQCVTMCDFLRAPVPINGKRNDG